MAMVDGLCGEFKEASKAGEICRLDVAEELRACRIDRMSMARDRPAKAIAGSMPESLVQR
jgi:hypothetical protein